MNELKKLNVKKAVIPAAGLGTRFLPATKTVPKEMLPIVDRPTLLYIIEEAVDAGIEDIVIISGRNKTEIEDFFDVSYELEDKLIKDGKENVVKMLRRIQSLANIISIRQKQALGLGHAVYTSKPVTYGEPFAVLLGDEIMINKEGEETVTGQLAKTFSETGLSTVAMMEVPQDDTHKYGIVEGEPLPQDGGTRLRVKNVIEKPEAGQTTSRWALPGRYVFSHDIFKYLENTKPGRNGEIQLTDAMVELARNEGLISRTFNARRYDAGDKLGFLQANIELAMDRPDLAEPLRAYIKSLAKRI
jgi:UTP--glucose-1-phosphate uridylyltransferase